MLMNLEQAKAAEPFLIRAIDTKLTDDEIQRAKGLAIKWAKGLLDMKRLGDLFGSPENIGDALKTKIDFGGRQRLQPSQPI